MAKVVVDPVTRIEGHLRITCVVENGRVTDAWTTAGQLRNFEVFMRDRDPRDAWWFGQRVCGVCPNPHAWNGLRASETAMGLDKVPDNARLVRNMMEAAGINYDHILHFYVLQAFDYVNVPDALNARPTTPSLRAVQDRVRAVVQSGQLGPFANHWWDHPGYRLTPEQNLELTAHYLQALEVQQAANDGSVILGGRFPMIHNYVPGGVVKLPHVEDILYWQSKMREVQNFVDTVAIPDLLTVAPVYRELATQGRGVGNYLSWGVLDGESQEPEDRLFPAGGIFDRNLSRAVDVDPDQTKIFTKHSWYDDAVGEGKHPLEAAEQRHRVRFTELPPITGEATPEGKYDWTMAARYGEDNRPMEVGPLALMLVSYVRGQREVRTQVDNTLRAIGAAGQPQVLMSNLGRIAARMLKLKINADNAIRWSEELLENIGGGNTKVFEPIDVPDSGTGRGGWDAPRGALCHYMRIEGGRIGAYAAVPASNWNLSPRDDGDVRGPVEQALIGVPVVDVRRPLEIIRTVHTFDP
ncbi:MAG: nickel-dependent hydrogenase large subunit [Actinobacteria bacterium]|nr:MAG: nickel-dependent hydrogenase large subunit [Actinomycetota bacterium]